MSGVVSKLFLNFKTPYNTFEKQSQQLFFVYFCVPPCKTLINHHFNKTEEL